MREAKGMHAVIVGSGGAGTSAVESFRAIDKESKLTLVTKDSSLPYSPCSLPYLLAGEVTEKEIVRYGMDWFERLKVKLLKGTEVRGLDTKSRTVDLGEKGKLNYDTVLIATGSRPIIPPIPGVEKRGVFTFAGLDDCRRLGSWIDTGAKRVVVVGAGFIGVECAIGLRKRGLDVTVVEMLETVLPKMLDPDMSERVQQILEEMGINFLLGQQVSEILGDERVEAAVVSESKLLCDAVVLGIGVRPNLSLLDGTDVKTNMGVVVDERMRTTEEGVFAAGDMVEYRDVVRDESRVNAIWPNAVEQGKVAGANMAGSSSSFTGSHSVNVVDLFGVPVLSAGYISSGVEGAREVKAERGRIAKKIILRGNRVVGFQAVGTTKNSGLIVSLMEKGEDVSEIEDALLDERFVSYLLWK